MMDKEHMLKRVIIFWAEELIRAVKEGDMPGAYDIQMNTLPKAWKLYNEHMERTNEYAT